MKRQKSMRIRDLVETLEEFEMRGRSKNGQRWTVRVRENDQKAVWDLNGRTICAGALCDVVRQIKDAIYGVDWEMDDG